MQPKANHSPLLIVRIAILAVLLQLVWAQPVGAHGSDGRLQVSGAPVGSFHVFIWTTPGILRTGEIHVETGISQGATPVTDCLVTVRITPPDGGAALEQLASAAEPANGFRHEAAFHLKESGRYQVVVSVLDPAGGGGETAFEMTVTRLPLWTMLLFQLLVGASVLFAVWFIRRGLSILT